MTSLLNTLVMKNLKTKKKKQLEANAKEHESEIQGYLRPHNPDASLEETKSEVIEWIKTQFLATAKAREILDDFYEGKENTGERE